MKRLAALSLLFVVANACSGSRTPTSIGTSDDHLTIDDGDLERVCIQNGVGGIGGGSLVHVLRRSGDTIEVETMTKHQVSIPAQRDGLATLCPLTPNVMKVCPADDTHQDDVPVRSAPDENASPIGTVPRGTAVTLWDYVADYNFAFVKIGDVQNGLTFVPASEICFDDSIPDQSTVTDQLGMIVKSAAPNTYRPRNPGAISRIAIHNTEATLQSTLNSFASGERAAAAHVVIDRDGQMYRIIDDKYSAFQAGGSTDKMGNYNIVSLGVENVAYDGASGFTPAQEASLIKLVNAWMALYGIQIDDQTIGNSSSAAGYADWEYGHAPLTIHRLIKASRGTDCPAHLFPNSPAGDEQFFRWRESNFGQ